MKNNSFNVKFITQLLVVTFIFSCQAIMANACLGEAQFIGKVKSITQQTLNSCLVELSDLSYFNASAVCSIDESVVLSQGITLPLNSNNSCNYNLQELSGTAVLSADGNIYLE